MPHDALENEPLREETAGLVGVESSEASISSADRWIEKWSGLLRGKEKAIDADPRVDDLLEKHLR